MGMWGIGNFDNDTALDERDRATGRHLAEALKASRRFDDLDAAMVHVEILRYLASQGAFLETRKTTRLAQQVLGTFDRETARAGITSVGRKRRVVIARTLRDLLASSRR